MARAVLIVLDSVGIGNAPDAAAYGDAGANTVLHIAEECARGRCDISGKRSGPLALPNLDQLGLGAALQLSAGIVAPNLNATPAALWGVGVEHSKGKDTPSGHWEITGVPVPHSWTVFPQTVPCFPAPLAEAMAKAAGTSGILGNKHASGTNIIAELGEEHLRTGRPIIYTSADSVIQIAAHEGAFGLDRLYELCAATRKLADPLTIGRVIARPFTGDAQFGFERTGNRRDYAIPPPGETLLDRLAARGRSVAAIGKISDIFAHRGITSSNKAHGNAAVFDETLRALNLLPDGGLVFANFVDFDSEFGHRRDSAGYALCLEEFDRRLPELLSALGEDDYLLITADHGNDPTWHGTDHTREQVPILCVTPDKVAGAIGKRPLSDIGATISEMLGVGPSNRGQNFLSSSIWPATGSVDTILN